MDLDYMRERILYGYESASLDFKKTQYEKKDDLLKDLIAMANNLEDSPKHIIVGVKYHPSGERDFVSLTKAIDDAEFQQLVHSNIEPMLTFSYEPLEVDGYMLGVFTIRPDPERRPYMMKKDFGTLKMGDAFIRRGSQQSKMLLTDFNDAFEVRHKIIKERETKVSHIDFFIKELKNNQVVLVRLKSYTVEGPTILELFEVSNELCNHFTFEIWDVLVDSGIISTLEFEHRDICRYAIKTIRDTKREIKTAAANWKRILKWFQHDIERKHEEPNLIIQIIPPEESLKTMMPGCKTAIDIAIDAVNNAILVLERIYDQLKLENIKNSLDK